MLLKNICLKDSRSSLLCSMPSLMSRHCMLSEMPRLVIDHRWWHPSLIHWSFLIGSFKVSIHWGVIGWMGPWPQFHWLVEVSMCLLKGVVSNCLECVRMILVFVTDFPISFFSFEDGVTVFLLMWSWLAPLYFAGQFSYRSLCFSFMVPSAECFFVWRFCGCANQHFARKTLTGWSYFKIQTSE